MKSRILRGARNTMTVLAAGMTVACSTLEGSSSPATTFPPELSAPPSTVGLPECQEFPALKLIDQAVSDRTGWPPTLAFKEDPGCEIPIRRYPNDFDKQVGSITVESYFTVQCIVDLPAPRLTGGVQESKGADVTIGFIELGFETPDPAIAPYLAELAAVCPPQNPDV